VAEVPEDDFILAEKKPSMPDFSPYKMGGMSLNPLRSLYDDINNILLYRTLQSTATRRGKRDADSESGSFMGLPWKWNSLGSKGKYKKNLVNLPWEMVLSSPMLRGK